mmetsp:Transcript_2264/g.6503  ORF Transcript_2264/g.6503 Transcript_2264/m.6503 type:complete len:303 (-) Transcript_2264:190-1098(-)
MHPASLGQASHQAVGAVLREQVERGLALLAVLLIDAADPELVVGHLDRRGADHLVGWEPPPDPTHVLFLDGVGPDLVLDPVGSRRVLGEDQDARSEPVKPVARQRPPQLVLAPKEHHDRVVAIPAASVHRNRRWLVHHHDVLVLVQDDDGLARHGGLVAVHGVQDQVVVLEQVARAHRRAVDRDLACIDRGLVSLPRLGRELGRKDLEELAIEPAAFDIGLEAEAVRVEHSELAHRVHGAPDLGCLGLQVIVDWFALPLPPALPVSFASAAVMVVLGPLPAPDIIVSRYHRRFCGTDFNSIR